MQVAIERQRLSALMREEEAAFARLHPASRALFQEAQECLLTGVPMPWMARR